MVEQRMELVMIIFFSRQEIADLSVHDTGHSLNQTHNEHSYSDPPWKEKPASFLQRMRSHNRKAP